MDRRVIQEVGHTDENKGEHSVWRHSRTLVSLLSRSGGYTVGN
jgi:hypothetical protein